MKRFAGAVTAALLLCLAAAAGPAQAATRHCSAVRTTKSVAFYSLSLSVPRCYDGSRVSVTGAPKVTSSITTLGLGNGYEFNGLAAAPATVYGRFAGHPRGAARVSRTARFGHCLDLGRLGCVLTLDPVVEQIGLRLFANGRSSGF
jgi:hypothetical protein